jgi:hypothetical protein
VKFSRACLDGKQSCMHPVKCWLRCWVAMVPEHSPSISYTHVTSGRVWNLGSVTCVSQSSACGGWLGVSYCSLSCVVSCTGGGLTRSTCLFHS